MNLLIEDDCLLGCPGPFVVDREKCSRLFAELGTERLVKQFSEGKSFEGMRTVFEGTKLFEDHIRELLNIRFGLGLMISHDAIIIPFLSIWFKEIFSDNWLDPLDGVLIKLDKKNNLQFYRK